MPATLADFGQLMFQPHQRTKINKTWGFEDWLWNGDKYCGKLLSLNMDKHCSWHYHLIKDEVFYVHNGLVELYYGTEDDISRAMVVQLLEGDVFHIPPGLRHRFRGIRHSLIIEVSTHHEESDSIRILPSSAP